MEAPIVGGPIVCRAQSAHGRDHVSMRLPLRTLTTREHRCATARINLRLPEHLKAGIEQAAGRERMSVNTWLVRTAAAALAQDGRGRQSGGRIGQAYTGWVR